MCTCAAFSSAYGQENETEAHWKGGFLKTWPKHESSLKCDWLAAKAGSVTIRTEISVVCDVDGRVLEVGCWHF